jgi:hypothetical protein
MYYTTNGAYRKSKMVIDYINIGLTAVIGVLFVIILFLRSRSGILFPIEFFAGAVMNGLTAIKNFMNKKRIAGIFLIIVTVILMLMSIVTLIIALR